jgi:ABC-type multidrug transport system ATPase subunit/ABC-type polysaccharide/polyol phosphate export permease
MKPAIQINNIHKSYGGLQALKGIDLTIAQGEFFALLGPNGAGKSTLISILAGLIKPSAGDISVMGFDVVTQYQQARQLLGIVPQELVFDPFFNVREMLRFQAGYFGRGPENDVWVDEILEGLGLTEKAHVNMRKLSGGMKRRALIAQALAHKPPVIVLDEPTAGVDVELRQMMWTFIKKLNNEGHTIILTTHYLEEAETLCSRVGMMKQGEIVALDSTANLLNKFAGKQLRLTLGDIALPANIQTLLRNQENGIYTFALNDMAQIELVLSSLRSADIKVIDMQLNEADLEDVFMSLVGQSPVSKSFRGPWTLLKKELLRFWRVAFQTVAAPVITALLYLLIFSHALESHVHVYDGVPYTSFLVPGLIMMSVLQNAFANSSSSLIQSKVMGNLVFVLLTPLTHLQFFIAFLFAAIIRGLVVGLCIYLVAMWFVDIHVTNFWMVFAFALLGSGLLGTFGIIAGIWADRFDQMAAFQNFIIMPLSFLSGVFYSIHSLPPFWQRLSQLNPFFYMIDGFRYGFFGKGDVSPLISLSIVGASFLVLAMITLKMLKSGYKLRA